MAVSHYFRHFPGNVTSEQLVYEDMIVESIKIMGQDIFYMPRDVYNGMDKIFGERPESKFEKAYRMEMYLPKVDDYGGQELFSKFGVEIKRTTSFLVSRRTFSMNVPSTITERPREGDLIYDPTLQRVFEITFVEGEEALFFPLGKKFPYLYRLDTEIFRYSDENLVTGVELIDEIEPESSYSIQFYLGLGSGNYQKGEKVTQGNAVGYVKNWDPDDKILDVFNIKGEFVDSEEITGDSSGASYIIMIFDPLEDHVEEDSFDNKELQDVGDSIVVTPEKNPFGKV